jgi:hypothetical protein
VKEKLAKVVYGVRHKGGYAEIICPRSAFFRFEVGKVYTGQVEKSIAIVSSKLKF